MRIRDILGEGSVIAALGAGDKEEALREIAQHLCQSAPGVEASVQDVAQALLGRERMASTGVGLGVAIPHAKIPGLTRLWGCFARHPQGLAFDAIDAQPVRLIFALLVPEHAAGESLKALARISRLLLKSDGLRERLLGLEDAHSLFQAFVEEDDRH